MIAALVASAATETEAKVGGVSRVDVVVIGAGWAGMRAAATLASARNVSVVVLEASNRTGGRTKAAAFGDPAVWRGVVEMVRRPALSVWGAAGPGLHAQTPNTRPHTSQPATLHILTYAEIEQDTRVAHSGLGVGVVAMVVVGGGLQEERVSV